MSNRENTSLLIKFALLIVICYLSPCVGCTTNEAIFLTANPAFVKWLYSPNKKHEKVSKFVPQLPQKRFPYINSDIVTADKVFRIIPTDAIVEKFSQPAVSSSNFHPHNVFGMKVPLPSASNEASSDISNTQHSSPTNFKKATFSTSDFEKSSDSPIQNDSKYFGSPSNKASEVMETTVYPVFSNSPFQEIGFQHDVYVKRELTGIDKQTRSRNNFTDLNASFLSDSSSPARTYQHSSDISDVKNHSKDVLNVSQNSNIAGDSSFSVSSPTSENQIYNSSDSSFSTISSVLNTFLSKDFTSQSVKFGVHSTTIPRNQSNNVFEETTVSSSKYSEENSSEITHSPEDNSDLRMSSGVVAGIVIAVLVSVTALSSAVIYLLYRRFHGKCTSVVEGKFNSDNCGYLDDSLRSSMYLNNHIELPKENSEEMTSLDNDSFLNSLETMTIQNYWADNSKNTKV